jgi:serine protease Do
LEVSVRLNSIRSLSPAAALLLCASAVPAQAQALSPLEVAEALERAFVDVVERVGPAVVTLDVASSRSGPDGLSEYRVGGAASGFIVNAEGLIYTNHHVLENAARIEVVLSDGRRFKADAVGSDPGSDIGVARILDPPSDLPFVELGDSDEVRVGQYAIAIGSPFGLDYADTVTVGHVSGKGRNRLGRGSGGVVAPGFDRLVTQDFIQVDTLIKPGNSGGPLVDIRGRVIGINTAIMGGGGEATLHGLGFAIPINLVQEIAAQLVATGRVVRGWVGVRVSTPDAQFLEMLGSEVLEGAMIAAIEEGGPGDAAGLEEGDIIIGFGSRKIRTADDFTTAVARAAVGEPVDVVVWREKGRRASEVHIELIPIETPPKPKEERSAKPKKRSAGTTAYLVDRIGAEFESVDAARNRELGRKRNAGGVCVNKVSPDSRAARAGLIADDIVLKVDHRDVKSPLDIAEAMRSAGREFVPLLVERAGKTRGMSLEQP